MFCKKGVPGNLAKFTGKHLCQHLFFKKETLAQVFSCEFCKISKNTFFTEHPQVTASTGWEKVKVLYLPENIHQGFNNVMERMKPQVWGNENSIIISACYWDFLQVVFIAVFSGYRTGSTYWAFVGATHLNIINVIQVLYCTSQFCACRDAGTTQFLVIWKSKGKMLHSKFNFQFF